LLSDEPEDNPSRAMIEMLETIDDDLDELGVNLVKISDGELAEADYGIERAGSPSIVYFENGIPSVFDGK
jgi:hypothetical protein